MKEVTVHHAHLQPCVSGSQLLDLIAGQTCWYTGSERGIAQRKHAATLSYHIIHCHGGAAETWLAVMRDKWKGGILHGAKATCICCGQLHLTWGVCVGYTMWEEIVAKHLVYHHHALSIAFDISVKLGR